MTDINTTSHQITVVDIWQWLDRGVVAYRPQLTDLTGCPIATLFFGQLIYWDGKQRDPEGWIYKTQNEFHKELRLSRWNQESARKRLKKLGLIEERYTKSIPRRLEFKLNKPNIEAQVLELIKTGKLDSLTFLKEKNIKQTVAAYSTNNPKDAETPTESNMMCDTNRVCGDTSYMYDVAHHTSEMCDIDIIQRLQLDSPVFETCS